MKVCPLCNRRYGGDRSVCEGDGTLLKEFDPVDLDETTNRLDGDGFDDTTNRLDDDPEFEDTTTKRATKEPSIDDMPPLLEVDVSTSVDEAPPAAVRELDAKLAKKPEADPNEALKPLPIASPRSGDHELDDDETAPAEGPTNVVDNDVPTLVAEPDSELREKLVEDAPDPLPPIKDADRIIEAAQRRVASERIQHQLDQLRAGELAPSPAAVDDSEQVDEDGGETDEMTDQSTEQRTEQREEDSEETTPIIVPTTTRDAEDDTVKVVTEGVSESVVPTSPPRAMVTTEKVSALTDVQPVQEEPSAVVPLARAPVPVPTEIAVPLPPPRPSNAVFWVSLVIVALVCLGIGFLLGRASV
jgi:hypothetical protein